MVDAVTSPSDPVDSRDSDKSHHWMPIQATYFYPQILLKKNESFFANVSPVYPIKLG